MPTAAPIPSSTTNKDTTNTAPQQSCSGPLSSNKKPEKEKRQLTSFLPFLISLSLPLLQVALIAVAIFTPYFENRFNLHGLAVLYKGFIGFFTVGLAADLIGATVAAVAAQKKKHLECLFPLVLNLLLLPTKAMLLFYYLLAICA